MSAPALVVDARRLFGSGIGRYVRELVPRIMRTGAFEQLELVGDPEELKPWVVAELPGARILPLPFGRYSLRAQSGWLGLSRHLPSAPRVIWFPHFDAPAIAMPRPSVVTVHDLIPLLHPGVAGLVKRTAMRLIVDRVTSQAARVITVSEATRQSLVEFFPAVAHKTRVIANGGAELAAIEAAPLPVGVRAPFLLCVANRKPHKNLVRAVELLAALEPTHPTLQLVVAGEWFVSWNEVESRASQLGVRERVVDVGQVHDGMLRTLYAQCEIFLAPSYLEGFGLPVVEAMACGAAVIAADLPWARALGGDAMRYADPDRVEPWTQAARTLLDDPLLRASCVARGAARATAFTWERAARETAALLLEVAAR